MNDLKTHIDALIKTKQKRVMELDKLDKAIAYLESLIESDSQPIELFKASSIPFTNKEATPNDEQKDKIVTKRKKGTATPGLKTKLIGLFDDKINSCKKSPEIADLLYPEYKHLGIKRKDFARRVTMNLSLLKSEGKIRSYQYSARFQDTAWGLPTWFDAAGNPKQKREYNEGDNKIKLEV